jgi:predicted MFS family arabinose efflux permease
MATFQATHPRTRPSPSLVLLLATGTGLAVASLYYSQPMLGLLGTKFHASDPVVGLVPTLTQLGYAFGILFLAPLGDRYDRKRIILIKAGLLCLSLLLGGIASTIWILLVSSLLVGLTATLAQDIVPAAATLAPDAERGKIVGTVMTGLLLGILLSRVISGFVAEHLGWRVVFLAAAGSIALIGVALWRKLPRFEPTTELGYAALLGSLAVLWGKHSELRRATIAQALLSVAFSAFWSTLAVLLHGAPFHLGSSAAGAFGLAGVAGALAAPLAGRMADRRGPSGVTRMGTAITVLAFGSMAWLPALSSTAGLWLLVGCAIGFDFGIQATLVAHQSIVYSMEPSARSRLNAVLLFGMFIGMATGAALGSLLLARWGWMAVTALTSTAALGALLVRCLPTKTGIEPHASGSVG